MPHTEPVVEIATGRHVNLHRVLILCGRSVHFRLSLSFSMPKSVLNFHVSGLSCAVPLNGKRLLVPSTQVKEDERLQMQLQAQLSTASFLLTVRLKANRFFFLLLGHFLVASVVIVLLSCRC